MIAAPQTDLYMNMSQFSDLKLSARKNELGAAKAAAQQFEGLFIQMMLKSMRAATVTDESQHSSNLDFYNDMHDKQISLMMAKSGGIGIAQMMKQQLGDFDADGQTSATPEGKTLPSYLLPAYQLPGNVSNSLPLPAMNYVAKNPAVKLHGLGTHAQNPQAQHSPVEQSTTAVSISKAVVSQPALKSETFEPFYGWSNATSFVNDLWPHAEKAATRLGVSAEVLVAQSALETG